MTDDERQIREFVDTWMAASKAGDLPSVLALMTDDVIFMTPGGPPFGRKEFAANGESMKDPMMEERSDIQEIEVFGTALTSGTVSDLPLQGRAKRRRECRGTR